MAGTQAVLTTGIFVLAIQLGTGGINAVDALMMTIAGAGVAGWLLVDEPIVATLFVVGADVIAAAMMTPKTYRDPYSETLSTFAFASVGGALAAGAVGVLDTSLLVYPVYYCVVNGAIAVLIDRRRRTLRSDTAGMGLAAAFPARAVAAP
jgi:hypothetical protein